MSTIPDQAGGGRALDSDPPPWYVTATTPAPDRRALEDEHTRILAQAVGAI